jgi:alanine racemase
VADETVQRAVARVSLGAIERNCRRLAEEAGDAALCAVVKADGYGHGAVPSARAALKGGARWLAVAAAAEAEELREALPKRTRLLTMGALTREELKQALEARSDVAIWDPDFAELAARTAARLGEPARVHVKYDSGMGRLGERDTEAVLSLVDQVAEEQHLKLIGFWTHFATADEPEPDYFEEQLARFAALGQRVREAYPRCLLHAANSAATLREPASHFDIVRCGIAIYGLDPYHSYPVDRGLEPALSLHSWVADVKRFPAGASAGYGRRWRAREDTWVGVLPIGYGDGVRRGLTNNADVLVGGERYPLVGTVSMDNITIDLGPETEVEPGDPAVLIGEQGPERILAEDVARRLDTINYEITCGISRRVPREHLK